MRKSFVFGYSGALESLDMRLSPSFLLADGVVASQLGLMADDEPLPAPEPSPGPNPGTAAPITPPPMPQVGPIGPGTS